MSERLRVLVREPIADSGLELLRQRFDVVEDSESDLASIIVDYDAIVIRSATTIDASLIDHARRLKVIGRAGVGVDNVDVEAATRRGIVVANAAESTVDSAAEHAIALLLALARNVPQAHAALTAGTWDRARFTGIELAGKTLGVLGLGRIGRQVAHRALGLGCASSRTTRSWPQIGSASSVSNRPARSRRSTPRPTSSRFISR